METMLTEPKTNDEKLFTLIKDFFDCRKLSEHLIFLDYWLKNSLSTQQHTNYRNRSELAFFSVMFSNLVRTCYELNTFGSSQSIYFEESIKISESYLIREQGLLLSYPTCLRISEICNPLFAITNVFKHRAFDFYNLSLVVKKRPARVSFQIYLGLKKLIEACWLIHERSISRNSFRVLKISNPNHDFALSCPLLLNEEFIRNPYLMVEEFFNYASIDEYREDLTKWFGAALNDQESYESAADLLFIHNQFLQIIQAAYLIGIFQSPYIPKKGYTPKHETAGHWLLATKCAYRIQNLSPHFQEHPIEYCIQNMTISDVIKLRYGLKEWLEAALSNHRSITHLEPRYIFSQYEELQKIMEALFLLIAEPALKAQSYHSPINQSQPI